MHKSGADEAEASFSSVFAGCLALGLMFAWAMFGSVEGDASFFLDAMESPAHAILLRVLTGCTFLALSLESLASWRGVRSVRAGALLGVASILACWCGTFAGPVALAVGGALSGVAFALFVCGWLGRYGASDDLLAMLLFSSFMGDVVYLGALFLGPVPSRVILLMLPLMAAAVLRLAPDADVFAADARRAGTRRSGSVPVTMVVSLLLVNFASGPASYCVGSQGSSGVAVGIIVMFCLACLFVLLGQPRPEVTFVLFAVGSLLCIAPVLMFASHPTWYGDLLSGCFWAMLLYSIAWFAHVGATPARGTSPACLRGLGAVYLLSALAEVVAFALTSQVACALALVMVGVALALALVGAMRAEPAAQDGSVAGATVAELERHVAGHTAASACPALAERYGLTAGELGVCEYLAKGYSLRQVASELGITEGAAKYHRHNVYQKCGVASRQELINLAESMARPARG